MKFVRTERGFGLLKHPSHSDPPEDLRLAQHSSAVGDYDDSFDRPGTSYLWIGDKHHLNREEVAEFVRHLQSWLDTGSLETKP